MGECVAVHLGSGNWRCCAEAAFWGGLGKGERRWRSGGKGVEGLDGRMMHHNAGRIVHPYLSEKPRGCGCGCGENVEAQ